MSCRVIPKTPFMGVRISWLTLARKLVLARSAASAARLAVISSRSFSRRMDWISARSMAVAARSAIMVTISRSALEKAAATMVLST